MYYIILYIIAFIAITVYYILDYARQENYSINYSYYSLDKSHKASNFTGLSFFYNISNSDEMTLSNMSLYLENEGKNSIKLPINEEITLTPKKNYIFYIIYECPDDNCIIDDDTNDRNYYINFNLSSQSFNLQKDNPKENVYGRLPMVGSKDGLFQFIEKKCIDLNFFGKEERPILSLKNRYDYNLKMNYTEDFYGKKYKLFGEIQLIADDYFWEQYIRKLKSWMQAVSNICSVNSTIYSILKLVFTFIYSTTFDNYKTIKNLLVAKKRIKYINIQENHKEKSSDFLLNPPNNNDNLITNNDDNEIENNKSISKDDRGYLPKLNFWDYIFNTFYCAKVCCCDLRKQKLISKCNDFLSNYYSIENILRNQIKLENLWKDYKWNNEKLCNFENNESIENIKKCAANIFIEYKNIN